MKVEATRAREAKTPWVKEGAAKAGVGERIETAQREMKIQVEKKREEAKCQNEQTLKPAQGWWQEAGWRTDRAHSGLVCEEERVVSGRRRVCRCRSLRWH